MNEAAASVAGLLGEHRTVTRVMAIIEMVVASEPKGVRLGDLATAISAPKSSIHGLAKGLVATGYLREEDSRYLTGPAIVGLLAAGPTRLPSAYRRTLERLTETCGETSILASLVGDALVYLAVVEPDTIVRASPQAHTRYALWPRSSGKIFLAHMEPRRIEAFLRREFSESTARDEVRLELETVKKTGLAVNTNGRGGDEMGIATRVTIARTPVNTAIAIAGPMSRMRRKRDDIVESLRKAAAELSIPPR